MQNKKSPLWDFPVMFRNITQNYIQVKVKNPFRVNRICKTP
jgi:hypothetical protein